jgi:hypothetical protein
MLPEYVDALATELTVHVTPIIDNSAQYDPTKNYNYVATLPEENKFTVHGCPGKFSWIVYGKRATVEVEPYKSSVNVHGDGPYRWIG